MSNERLREKVLDYLYGELSPAEETAFRKELEGNAELARLLAEEERFQERFPAGGGAEVPEDLLQESRLLLRAALRQENQGSRFARLAEFLRGFVPRLAWAGGAMALLLCGVILGRALPIVEPEMDAVSTIGQVVDLQVKGFDPVSGRVQLRVSALSSQELEGGLEDERIKGVLAAALLGDLESGARLQAVKLLRYQAVSGEIRQSLVHALLEDENPGVRLQAVEALQGLTGDEQVLQALRQALLEDGNPGVRVAAIEALRNLQDQATLEVLVQKSVGDENEYIRAEARQAVDRWRVAARAQQL